MVEIFQSKIQNRQSKIQMSQPSLARMVKTQIAILFGMVAILWCLEVVDQLLFGGQLDLYGISPRSQTGLRGILFSPFLHGNFRHLSANTVPLVVLGWLIMVRATNDFWWVTAIVMAVSGLGVWLLGAPGTIHIGASGLIFGYFGFLLFRAYFERSATSIALSFLVIFFYGSLIWGVLPLQDGVSWEGHLFGFIGGAIAARLFANPLKT